LLTSPLYYQNETGWHTSIFRYIYCNTALFRMIA